MKNLEFTPTVVEHLQTQADHHPHPRVRKKMLALVMKSTGIRHHQIASTINISGNTLRAYMSAYELGGIEALEKDSFYKPESKLRRHNITLKEYFTEHPPRSVKEARSMIKSLIGVEIGMTQTRLCLKTLGLRRRLTGILPAKADAAAQELFLETQLRPILQEAQDGLRTVFFVDAAHFVFSVFQGFLWCFSRIFIKSNPGRKRFNVLGALDAVTHELITVTNDTYINALSVCELLQKIASEAISGPVTVVLDNAAYQRCALVTTLAKELDIGMIFLPPYSPNLNLIERFWKLVKKSCLQTTYHKDFEAFKESISNFVHHADDTHSKELETLLTHKFQKFQEPKKQAA